MVSSLHLWVAYTNSCLELFGLNNTRINFRTFQIISFAPKAWVSAGHSSMYAACCTSWRLAGEIIQLNQVLRQNAHRICMPHSSPDYFIQGPDSILRCHLTSIGKPIVEIRRSYDRLISTMGFPILVRWHLYIELGPWMDGQTLNHE